MDQNKRSKNREQIEAAREDPNEFVSYCFSDKHGTPLHQGKIHLEWQQLWTDGPRSIIKAPRDHGKTTQLLGRVLWELGRNHNLRIKLICQSDPKARERLSEIRMHIERNERVKEVFPDLLPDEPSDGGEWSKHRIRVQRTFISKDPSVEAHGVTSSGTGGRADLLIADDVVDLRNAILLPALRQVVKVAFKSVWINLLEPDGRLWYIATPWHADDLTAELETNDVYERRDYPIGEHIEPVWPEGWPMEALQERLREIGPKEFGRSFQLRALSDEDMTFPSFEAALERGRGLKIADLVSNDDERYAGADLSGSKRKGTVLFCIARLRESGIRVPVGIERGAWKSPETVRRIHAFYRNHLPALFYVENNGIQQSYIDWTIESKEDVIPIAGFMTGSNKADPNNGLPGIEVELANGGWVIPWGEFQDHDSSCDCGWCEWVREMKTHPIYKSTDHVMAMWFAREAARRWHPDSRQEEKKPPKSDQYQSATSEFMDDLSYAGLNWNRES